MSAGNGVIGNMPKGSAKGASKSSGGKGGKKGLVTSPFQKPIAGRKIGK